MSGFYSRTFSEDELLDVARLADLAGIEAPYCCSSCHDDDDDGYSSLSEVYPDAGVIVAVCCAKTSWVREHWHLLAEVLPAGEWRKVDELDIDLLS